MTRGCWLEGETCDVVDTKDETKDIDLLGREIEVFWDDTKERKFL